MDRPECQRFTGRLRDLCEGRGLDGRGDPPSYAVEAFRSQHGLWPLGSAGEHTATVGPFLPRTVAVAVICHNYGKYLAEALESVLEQSRKPDEIIVIDDSSTDDTCEVANAYANRGVRYKRIHVRNVHQARRAGYLETESEALCFLDADDKLDSRYLEWGLLRFTESRVAVVYSDIEFFGNRAGRSLYPQFDHDQFQRDNFLHSGSLVRREVLDITRPFDMMIDPLKTQADWFLWRCVIVGSWTARKQSATYFYRQHQTNWMHEMRRDESPKRYVDYAGLRHETITLFVPLSGRVAHWRRLSAFLERQTWPHSQVKLILLDTSRDQSFQRAIREWICQCDYGDVRHLIQSVEESGLADEDRTDINVRRRVAKAMWRIYGFLPQVVETEYVWILEDDILPADDVCQRLFTGFDSRTASVAAPYRSRYVDAFVVWDQHWNEIAFAGNGTAIVGGNGFGCVILRRSAFNNEVFSRFQQTEDFDIAFYRKLARTPLVAKVDWSCHCEHGLERGPSPLRKAVNFGTAIIRHTSDGLKKVDHSTYTKRLAICGDCTSCDTINWICLDKACGCKLKIKAGWRSETCPQGRWDQSKTSSDSTGQANRFGTVEPVPQSVRT